MPSTELIALVALAVQASLQMLTMRYSRMPSQPSYVASTAVVTAEAIKMVASAAILFWEQLQGGESAVHLLWRDIVADWRGTLHISAPAVLYLVQNNLLYLATSNLEAAVCQVAYQLKLFTAALFTVLLLRRPIPPARWLALALLFTGAAVVVWSSVEQPAVTPSARRRASAPTAAQAQAPGRSPAIGLTAVLFAAVLSGLSGVWVESIVKRSPRVSVAVRNMQLGGVSLLAGLASVLFLDGGTVGREGFFGGYTLITWLVVLQVAAGGLIIGVIHKYADNVAKGFATSLSIVLSSLASWGIPGLGSRPSLSFVAGAAMVAGATILFYCAGPPAALLVTGKEKSEETTRQAADTGATGTPGGGGGSRATSGGVHRRAAALGARGVEDQKQA